MTDLAEEIDLDAAAEGVKSLYKAPQPKVLDPEIVTGKHNSKPIAHP